MRGSRFHKSFEEELAGKADEFKLKPSERIWEGIESGLTKKSLLRTRWKMLSGGAGLALIAVFLFLLPNEPTTLEEIGMLPEGFRQESSIPDQQSNTPVPPGNPLISPAERPINRSRALAEIQVSAPDIELPRYQDISVQAVSPKWMDLPGLDGDSPDQNKRKSFKGFPDFHGGWNFSIQAGPAYSFHDQAAKTPFARSLAEIRKKTDAPSVGFVINAKIRYYLSRKFSVSFGLSYRQNGEKIAIDEPTNTSYYQSLANEYHYSMSELYSVGNSRYYRNRYRQYELPVMVHHSKMLSPKLGLTSGIGLSLAYVNSDQVIFYDYRVDHYTRNPKFMRDWNLGLQGQLLAEYCLNSTTTIQAGADLSYNLFSSYSDFYPISQKQYSLGAVLGVQWRFRE